MSEKVSVVNHEAIKSEAVKQTVDGFERQLVEASNHINEAHAKVDALNFKSDATDHVYAKAELRDAQEEYQPVLDDLSEQWAAHGGARIDAARAAVDALNFKSDATDHVYAKAELRDAEDAWVESYNTAHQESKLDEPEEEVSIAETNVGETEEASTSEESAALQVQNNEVFSPLDHPVEVAVQDGELREEYEKRIDANRKLVPVFGNSIEINDPLEFTADDAEEERVLVEETQDAPEAEAALNTNKLNWKDALSNPGGYLATRIDNYRLSHQRIDDDHTGERRGISNKNLKRLIGATAGVIIAVGLYRLGSGSDIFGDHSVIADAANNTVGHPVSGNGGGDVAPAPAAPIVESGGHGQDWSTPNYSEAARTVTDGEGLNQTFSELNIPESEWPSLVQKVGPQLVEPGWTYRMPDGSWGISHTGVLPDSVVQLIQNNR